MLASVVASPSLAYDAVLAETLGADERGMKMYALVLLKSGPLERNDRYRGIFIFNVKTSAEAEALLATDPAVQAGALAGDVYLLYGSAALHRRISKD
jgi:hypothetical protein